MMYSQIVGRRWSYLKLLSISSLLFVAGGAVEAKFEVLQRIKAFVLPNPAPVLTIPKDPDTRAALLQGPKQLLVGSSDPVEDSRRLANVYEWLRGELWVDRGADQTRNDVDVLREEDLEGSIRRTLITLRAYDGARIPAMMIRPVTDEPLPLIAVIPGHVRDSESGLAQTAGLVQSYQHSAALELARAGFATITLELRGFGLLGQPFGTEHRLVAYNAISAGSSYKSVLISDIEQLISWSATLPGIDARRIGITGVSFGGELAVTYAALDPRITVVVFQGYGGPMGPFEGTGGNAHDQPHYCHVIPGQRARMRQEDVILLLAPRPTLGIRGTREGNWSGELERLLINRWMSFPQRGPVRLERHDGGHEYFVEPAVEFFEQYL